MKIKFQRYGFTPTRNCHLKIIAISDTHGERFAEKFNRFVQQHKKKVVDIFLYVGDFSKRNDSNGTGDTQIQRHNFQNDLYDYHQQSHSFHVLSEEMKKIKYCSHKFMILGNHDVPYMFTGYDARKIEAILGGGVRVLNNEHADIYYQGKKVKIYGTSYSGEDMSVWNKIPSDTNILCTHVPPKGFFDDRYSETKKGNITKIGPTIKSSAALRKKIDSLNLELVCCGHNHNYEGDNKWSGDNNHTSVFCAGNLINCSKHLLFLRVTSYDTYKKKKKEKEEKKKS